jgi:hypothetical protein
MFIRASCACAYTRYFRPANTIFRPYSSPRLNKFDRAGQVPIYYKRSSSVTFRIQADTRKTLCDLNVRKTLCNSIIWGKPYVEHDTLEKRSRNAMACTPLVATCHDIPLGPYSRGCAIWLVAWVRFSSVTFRIMADTY